MVMFEKERDAYVVEKRRFKGTFLETLELKYFPFDIQVILVRMLTTKVDILKVYTMCNPVARREWNIDDLKYLWWHNVPHFEFDWHVNILVTLQHARIMIRC